MRIKELRFTRKKDISRDIMKEMRLLRELRHDNINSFIGACVEPMRTLLVTDYCAKGSLYDIIENEDIKLDGLFIASLIHDLIKVRGFILITYLQSLNKIWTHLIAGNDLHSRFRIEFPWQFEIIKLCRNITLDASSSRFWFTRSSPLR